MGQIDEQKERQRLAALYARLEEGELEEIAGDADSLTAVAREALRSEKTRRRGASKTRVITTSRSVGVVTCNVPEFFIGDLLYCFVQPR